MKKTGNQKKELRRNNFFVDTVFQKYLSASILGMLATSAGGMIDTMIVGRFMGEEGLAAMSLIAPVYLIYYTIGAVIGIGGAVSANYAIGNNQYEQYNSIFTLSFLLLAVMCLTTTVFGSVFLARIVSLLGGKGNIGQYSEEYLKYYIWGGSATLLIYIPLQFLRTEGKPEIASRLFFCSSGFNIVLTFLFLSPIVNMGIKGASIATALSMGITACIGYYILLYKSANIHFCFRFSWQNLREILTAGSPNGANNLFQSLRIMGLNQLILFMGAQALLPVFVLVKSTADIMLSIMAGISNALIPIIGVYYGEKDYQSIRSVLHKSAKIGGLMVAGLSVMIALCPKQICLLFNIKDTAAREEAGFALCCLSASLIFAFLNLLLMGYFNAVNRPALSNVIIFLRLLLYMVAPACCLSKWLGMDAIWISQIVAEVLTLVTAAFLVKGIRCRHRDLDLYLLNRKEEGTSQISFSVRNHLDDVIFASTKITDFCQENEFDGIKSMQVSLALEEMLTIIISFCMDSDREQFIDITIKKLEESILIRIRNSGKIFNPLQYYEENKDKEEMFESLLGIQLIITAAKKIEFREIFGANSLLIYF